ncbi:UDP-N-acetylmuramate dehydrogenase [Algibacillus agarilyticus]|uniref:UDP-N-acetylmuramate dehydrogenase n=1 Tax=Algibacillus agarilyticus TaxID=2234133 RepID=UPI000DD0C695|nr:UDP-N-acetylmuramate dehydrogenase [Algibacillus agarilyticus]
MNNLIPNTFGLAVKANHIVNIDANTQPRDLPEKLVVVGEGSNILFVTNEVKFALASCQHDLFEVIEFDDYYNVHLGAGLNWHCVVTRLLAQGIYGLENLALIPGTVGAAPVQNIGAYGVEFSQFCRAVIGIDLVNKQRETLLANDCQFAYRDSIFKHARKHTFVIETVCLHLPKKWLPVLNYGPLQTLSQPVTAQAIYDRVCETRKAKLPDPKKLGNAGSFFKNPIISKVEAEKLKIHWPSLPTYPVAADDNQVKVAAGYLIDQAGLKGFAVNDAAVHVDQALVLVNLSAATYCDVIELAKHIRASVSERFGILLEPEVRFFNAIDEINPESVL